MSPLMKFLICDVCGITPVAMAFCAVSQAVFIAYFIARVREHLAWRANALPGCHLLPGWIRYIYDGLPVETTNRRSKSERKNETEKS